MKRETKQDKLIIYENGKTKKLNLKEFCEQHNIHTTIMRIRKEDYPYLKNKKTITLFNISPSGHKPGDIYALARIKQHGHYKNENDEKLPVLSFDNCLIGQCVEVREDVQYSELTEKDFEHSIETIKNVDDLKKDILKRYTQSLPNFGKEELLAQGVSITTLKIKGKLKFGEF